MKCKLFHLYIQVHLTVKNNNNNKISNPRREVEVQQSTQSVGVQSRCTQGPVFGGNSIALLKMFLKIYALDMFSEHYCKGKFEMGYICQVAYTRN